MKKIYFNAVILLSFLVLSTTSKAEIVYEELSAFTIDFAPMQGKSMDFDGTTIEMEYTEFGGIIFRDPTYSNNIIFTDSPASTYSSDLKYYEFNDLIDGSNYLNLDGINKQSVIPGEEEAGIHYIGFKSLNGNFGWIKIDVTPGTKFDVLSVAYDDAGQPIEAGDTGNVSISNKFSFASVSVYPNPATEYINISIAEFNGDFNIQIIDILGREILTETMEESTKNIDIQHLHSGAYFLKIENIKGDKVATLKLDVK